MFFSFGLFLATKVSNVNDTLSINFSEPVLFYWLGSIYMQPHDGYLAS